MIYVECCAEHEVPLNEDGTCVECRDAEGKPFVLDMQSKVLFTLNELEELFKK